MATYKVVTHHLQELTWEVEADSPEEAEEKFGSEGTVISDESNESETIEVTLNEKENVSRVKYTQGPWEFRQTSIDDSAFISDIHAPHRDNPKANGEVVWATDPTIATTWYRSVDGQAEANARLISAAPELFEAIKEVVWALESYCNDWNSTQPTDVTVCLPQLKIAMAKAVGIKEYFEEY